jgi:hypothetical protein
MAPAPGPSTEDHRVVVTELVVHLGELGCRDVVDARQLSQLWLQVRQCDSAALDSLGCEARQAYLSIVTEPRRPPTRARVPERAALRRGQANLRVAIHRRIMMLHLVARSGACQPGCSSLNFSRAASSLALRRCRQTSMPIGTSEKATMITTASSMLSPMPGKAEPSQ